MRSPSALWAAVAAVVLVATLGPAVAAEPRSQDGLPPELVIADTPALNTQLQTLQNLVLAGKASGGKTGGFLGNLRGMFGGGGKALPLGPAELAASPEGLRSQLVSVSGLYRSLGKERGEFVFEGGKCPVSVPTGVMTEGIAAGKLDGMPLTIEGVAETTGQLRATKIMPCGWLAAIRAGRIMERLGRYGGPDGAAQTYEKASQAALAGGNKSFTGFANSCASFAKLSAARLAYDELRDVKKAKALYSAAWNPFTPVDRRGKPMYYTWVPREESDGWDKLGVADAITEPLDALSRTGTWYRVMGFFVDLSGGVRWLGILLLAILSRVIIWPLTKKQLASAEAMKRLQPQIKALQERHADSKQKFQEEFWKLCQANGVNPLGGCLPMIIQIPILIVLWQGIRDYIVQFNGHSFAWVKNLAAPDTPLLVAYTLSMILFQKMTQKLQPNPTMTNQQQQQQQMMTYMMPIMFFVMFKGFPAAFLLYWLATNIVYFAQQYLYTRSQAKHVRGDGTASLVAEGKGAGGPAGDVVKALPAADKRPGDEGAAKKTGGTPKSDSKGPKAAKQDGAEPKKRSPRSHRPKPGE